MARGRGACFENKAGRKAAQAHSCDLENDKDRTATGKENRKYYG